MKAAPKLGLHGALCKCLVVHEKACATKFAGLNAGHDGFLWVDVDIGAGWLQPGAGPKRKTRQEGALWSKTIVTPC